METRNSILVAVTPATKVCSICFPKHRHGCMHLLQLLNLWPHQGDVSPWFSQPSPYRHEKLRLRRTAILLHTAAYFRQWLPLTSNRKITAFMLLESIRTHLPRVHLLTSKSFPVRLIITEQVRSILSAHLIAVFDSRMATLITKLSEEKVQLPYILLKYNLK